MVKFDFAGWSSLVAYKSLKLVVVGSNPTPATGKSKVVVSKKETKNNIGRPRSITPKKLEKLEEAFKLGCTNREACFYADVAESTFYDFLNEYPDYSDKIKMWKDYQKIKARYVVHKALEKGDRDMAKWYLERKAKDEFSTKQEVDTTIKDRVVIVNDLPDEE